ncbi:MULTISPECIES: hypothetical protein [unclassified Mesorhizobium]|uniref:hypothetical protein n=1 Tax=unclassified Mesorhizobium TaxID=325217 RepID=UPI001125E704|nr:MULTISPECIES: hypothetical protein [unclassified Mesorhizobium]TPK97629.1 hypothetical protein FJ567_18835 [Mesorhizobium sp. B2-4-16]TPL64450.1 hypothetical protein FJ956_22405 [Mesorhizobium sp. B2-4-3]
MNQRVEKIIDRPDAPEIFCDGALAISFRQDVLRLTLYSDRIDAAERANVNRVVVGQLSMPPAGFVDLYNQMTAVMARLTQAGKVQPVEQLAQQLS